MAGLKSLSQCFLSNFGLLALAHRCPSWDKSRLRKLDRYTQPNMLKSYHNQNRGYRSKRSQLDNYLLLHSRSDDQKHRYRTG
jgi:hypothetical protein